MKAAIEAKRPIPPSILNAPVVPPESQFYLQAFCDLSTCRQIGFGGFGSIPWTAMNEYAIRFNVECFDMFSRIIRALDGKWLERSNSKKD